MSAATSITARAPITRKSRCGKQAQALGPDPAIEGPGKWPAAGSMDIGLSELHLFLEVEFFKNKRLLFMASPTGRIVGSNTDEAE